MTIPFDPAAASSVAQPIAYRVDALYRVPAAHLHLWLPALTTPPEWVISAVDEAAVTRLLLRRLSPAAHWDGCEAFTLYRIPGAPPPALVLDNADRLLRDSHATDIHACQLDVPRRYKIAATRSSVLLYTINSWCTVTFTTTSSTRQQAAHSSNKPSCFEPTCTPRSPAKPPC